MSTKLTEAEAIAEIDAILSDFAGIAPPKLRPTTKLVGGKLYELYVLARALQELASRGWYIYFRGSEVKFRASPGDIHTGDPHFEIQSSASGAVEFEVHTDVQVMTLGFALKRVNDRSGYHEIDIVAVRAGTTGKPRHDQIALGIECKSNAEFSKAHVREVLGRRRELSMYTGVDHLVPLARNAVVSVKVDPPSEYWLRYIDSKGDNYSESPAVFGVDLQCWCP